MFVQDNVYIPTEYGTWQCKPEREPCGAFYGLPFSGEITGQAIAEREQVQAFLPDRYFSDRDELVLAHLRGERLDEQPAKIERRPTTDENDPNRVRGLVDEFRNNTQAPLDVVAEYASLAREYVKGKKYLLEKMHELYRTWMERKPRGWY